MLGVILPGLQARVQAVEASLPEAAVGLEPLGSVLQRPAAQPRWAKLRGSATLDQTGALEHPEVLRDRLDGDRERLCQFLDGRLPAHETCKDRPAGRIGEGGEGGAELVNWHVFTLSVYQLIG